VLTVKLAWTTKNTVVEPDRLNLYGAMTTLQATPPKIVGFITRVLIFPAVLSSTFVVPEIEPDISVKLVVAPFAKYASVSISQSPADSVMLVTVFGVAVVRATAEPDAMTLSTYSPTTPVDALSLVVVPRGPAVVGENVRLPFIVTPPPPAASCTPPVDTFPIPIAEEPLALIAIGSLAPDDIADSPTPPAAANPVTFNPVACKAVDASTCSAGFVVPFNPTANALADGDVTVCALLLIVAAVSVPVNVGDADSGIFPVPVTALLSVTPPYVKAPLSVVAVPRVIEPVALFCRNRPPVPLELSVSKLLVAGLLV
jgi:hypothetical protein